MTDIQWGPEIKVDGKRPSWLQPNDMIQIRNYGSFWSPRLWAGVDGLATTDLIRLPANHPHYAHQTPTPDVVGIAPELVERMMGLCEALIAATPYIGSVNGPGRVYEAHRVLPLLKALLPEPVDGDLVEAREAVIDAMPDQGEGWQNAVRKGSMDGGNMIAIARAARRRALERGEA